MGYLNATPEGDKKSRREQHMEGGGGSPLLFMPPVNHLEYLLDLWHQAGTISNSAGGVGRLTWDEIDGWLSVRKRLREPELMAWEVYIVRRLSEEYANEYNSATDKMREPPYQLEDVSVEDLDRPAIASKIKNILGGFKKNPSENKYEVEERS